MTEQMAFNVALRVMLAIAVAVVGAAGSESEGCDFSEYAPSNGNICLLSAAREKVVPTYPEAAIRDGVYGDVKVMVLVTRSGRVRQGQEAAQMLARNGLAAALKHDLGGRPRAIALTWV